MSKTVTTKGLLVGYKQRGERKIIAGPIDESLNTGELIALIGPNGSGKTTLLRTLSGVQNALAGEVKINGKEISLFKPADLARKLAVVLTDRIGIGNISVYALVSLGRYPYTNWLGGLSRKDEEIIKWSIDITNTSAFIDRQIQELSDGERQKVMIARALSQETEIVLLDEPTAHLDLPNRVEIFQLLRKLAKETNKAILLSTHELDLAMQTADRIWLVDQSKESDNKKSGNKIICAAPEDLVLNGSFERVFEGKGISFDKNTGRFILNNEYRETVNLTGEGLYFYWTLRALERAGFRVDNFIPAEIKIKVEKQNWKCRLGEEALTVSNITELMHILHTYNCNKKKPERKLNI